MKDELVEVQFLTHHTSLPAVAVSFQLAARKVRQVGNLPLERFGKLETCRHRQCQERGKVAEELAVQPDRGGDESLHQSSSPYLGPVPWPLWLSDGSVVTTGGIVQQSRKTKKGQLFGNCGLRIADCGLGSIIKQSAIRNPQSGECSARNIGRDRGGIMFKQ